MKLLVGAVGCALMACGPVIPARAQTASAGMEGRAAATAPAAAPIEIRTVIVTAFEIGEDVGDRAGEYQAWAAVMPEVLPFPAGFRHLRYDPARKALLLSTGIGTNRAAASTMALALDPRFDLSHAYWLVAAIAGVNPEVASVGSAAWIGDVVDTDYGYAVDAREAPAGWTTGMFPRDRKTPYEAPRGDTRYNLFPLNKGLRDWAFALTSGIRIPDTPALREIRAAYRHQPAAQKPPFVLKGAEASGQTFWHGTLLNTHVDKWVSYWTDGGERFAMTAMEDTGVAGALAMAGRLGRVDPERLLVLRTGSNYSAPPPGIGAAESLVAESSGLSALQASLDTAFLIGMPVVEAIDKDWHRYRGTVPGTSESRPGK
ncbi:purine nucleoside permease [Sphingomonas zeicaulis]|uniref:purine nucleoside permease n=1 Tax=Sphingomonas zeicaulis TaxID=1632740 RepID=UPI003D1E80C1